MIGATSTSKRTVGVLVAAILVLTGCGSIRGERRMVGPDDTDYGPEAVEGAAAAPRTARVTSTGPPVVEIDADTAMPAALGFTVDLLDGESTSGIELAARGPVHIVFLQPTCPISAEEGPKLAGAARRHPGVTYVVAHSGGTVAGYLEVIVDAGLAAPNVVHVDDSDQRLWKRFGIEATPSSILVDDDGLVRSSHGALGESGLERAADALLAGF